MCAQGARAHWGWGHGTLAIFRIGSKNCLPELETLSDATAAISAGTANALDEAFLREQKKLLL